MKKIITIILIMSAFAVYAGGDKIATNNTVNNEINNITLAPITPIEATFEDNMIFVDIDMLKPITPKEATFEDDTIK